MNKIVIGAILLVFIGGIVALVIWIISSSSASGPLPNDCNKRVGETKTYKLAYTSLKDKTTPHHGWDAGGNDNVICYYDKEATKQVSKDDCLNYYAVDGKSANDSKGFTCYNDPGGECIVYINPAHRMNGKKSCPNDWKNSGYPVKKK